MSLQPINRQYLLKAGDTLHDLAYQQLGGQTHFRELADFNNLDIFEPLPVGQPIEIPTQEQLQELTDQAQQQIQRTVDSLTDQLDLSGIKQPDAAPQSLISWVL